MLLPNPAWGQKEPCALQCFRPPSSAAPCGLQARDHTMRGLRKGKVALSKAPVLPGARSADMAQGIERYPFQLYTYTRTGLVAWVLSGADVDDTMAWCDALKRAGVKGSIQFEPKRKSMTARARHSLQLS